MTSATALRHGRPSPSDGATLVCAGVTVAVGGVVILRDLDLTVPAGRLTVIVGPSGAGKTTLLRAIAGRHRSLTGTVRLGDRNLTAIPTHRRRLAAVFQEPRLFGHMTVGDNVAFPLRMAGHAQGAATAEGSGAARRRRTSRYC